MQIVTGHPLKNTHHAVMFDGRYRVRASVPVLRRIAGFVTRTMYVDVLRNNANIVRPSWHRYFNVGSLTIAVVLKG